MVYLNPRYFKTIMSVYLIMYWYGRTYNEFHTCLKSEMLKVRNEKYNICYNVIWIRTWNVKLKQNQNYNKELFIPEVQQTVCVKAKMNWLLLHPITFYSPISYTHYQHGYMCQLLPLLPTLKITFRILSQSFLHLVWSIFNYYLYHR